MNNEDNSFIVLVVALGALLLGVVALFAWIGPQYNVWQKGMNGQALLMEAESSRQIRVAEARAKLDSSVLEAQAEVKRAEGQATANKLLESTLTPEVLQYQYIRVLEEQGQQGDRTVVYIPTDSRTGLPMNLPTPEANRLK